VKNKYIGLNYKNNIPSCWREITHKKTKISKLYLIIENLTNNHKKRPPLWVAFLQNEYILLF